MIQKLIRLGDKWHLAHHVGAFTVWQKEFDQLFPDANKKAVNYKNFEGRITFDAWCDEASAFICAVGSEDQVADMPEIEDRNDPEQPVIGMIWVCHTEDADATTSSRPLKAFTSEKMADEWWDRNPENLGGVGGVYKKYTPIELRGKPHQLENLRRLLK